MAIRIVRLGSNRLVGEGLRIDSQNAGAWANFALAYGFLKKDSEAIEAYRQATQEHAIG